MKLLFVIIGSWIMATIASRCNTMHPTFGPPNSYPINDNPQMTLLNTTKNGKLYQVTVPNGGGSETSTFYLTHVYGTSYEMGRAQGELLRTQIQQFQVLVWKYFEEQVESQLWSWFPAWFAQWISDLGLDVALDLTAMASEAWTSQYIYDELHGIADGAQIDYKTLLRIHMIAGLTEGKCSMFGAWGDALDPAYRGSVIQLRALDWNMDGPFRDYSAITVYHPSDKSQNAVANVGFVSWVGGLTGMSSQQLGISEIGVSYPDSSFGSESRIGIPFVFLLRDILTLDPTLKAATSRIVNEKRTCDLLLGVGDGKSKQFLGYQYSSSVAIAYNDSNLNPDNSTWHPRIKNIVYWGMDWLCPGYNKLLSTQLQLYYGKISPEIAIHNITAAEQSGSNHIAYYDLTNMYMWVSFAAGSQDAGPVDAWARQFTKFDVNKLFAEQL